MRYYFVELKQNSAKIQVFSDVEIKDREHTSTIYTHLYIKGLKKTTRGTKISTKAFIFYQENVLSKHS